KSANKKSNASSDARPKKLFARIPLTTLRVSCRGVRPPSFQRDFTSFRVECFVLFISSDLMRPVPPSCALFRPPHHRAQREVHRIASKFRRLTCGQQWHPKRTLVSSFDSVASL